MGYIFASSVDWCLNPEHNAICNLFQLWKYLQTNHQWFLFATLVSEHFSFILLLHLCVFNTHTLCYLGFLDTVFSYVTLLPFLQFPSSSSTSFSNINPTHGFSFILLFLDSFLASTSDFRYFNLDNLQISDSPNLSILPKSSATSVGSTAISQSPTFRALELHCSFW